MKKIKDMLKRYDFSDDQADRMVKALKTHIKNVDVDKKKERERKEVSKRTRKDKY